MLDRYWHGPTGRISPGAGPRGQVEHIEERPGGAANVALNSAALGAQAVLLGLTGQDEAADALASQMAGVKVACDFVRLTDYPTITKLRVLSRNQQLSASRLRRGLPRRGCQPADGQGGAGAAPGGRDDPLRLRKGALNDVPGMIRRARAAGIPVLVDPKGTDFEVPWCHPADPNMSEFEAVVGKVKGEEDLVARGLELVKRFELDALLVTRSENGMTLIREGQPELHLPAQAHGSMTSPVPVTPSSPPWRLPLPQARVWMRPAPWPNTAAGIVVGKLGTSTVSPVELANALYTEQETGFGVMSEAQLRWPSRPPVCRGEKVVMTNGCFDILHAGHVSPSGQCGQAGDRLIVAVNTDESVRRLRGRVARSTRPSAV